MQTRLATTLGAIATLAASTQAQPATSNWALSGADQQRTGRSQFAGSTDGLLQWRLGILGNGEPHTAGVVLGSGGEIYVGTMSRPSNQGMYAVSADGTVLWNNSTPSRIQRAGAVLQDGSILALSRDHSIYNFASNGSINWAVDPDVAPIRDFFSSPNVGNDGTIYAARQNSGLYAFNPDGSVKWNVESGVTSGVSPAIDHGGNIIWGGDDGILRAVNSSGVQQWSRDLDAPLITSSPSVSHDGTVFIGTVDNGLFALDGSGDLLWHRSDINGVLGSVAVRADGSLVVAGAGNTLWSLGLDGSTQWVFDGEGTAAEILSSPIVDADGRVFASMDTDTMFGFDHDGSMLFEYQTGGSILAPGALSDLGTLYFGSTDGFLYAVGTPIPAPSALFVIPSALVFTSRRRR